MVVLHSKRFSWMAWRSRAAISSSGAPARCENYENMVERMVNLARFLPEALAKTPP